MHLLIIADNKNGCDNQAYSFINETLQTESILERVTGLNIKTILTRNRFPVFLKKIFLNPSVKHAHKYYYESKFDSQTKPKLIIKNSKC